MSIPRPDPDTPAGALLGDRFDDDASLAELEAATLELQAKLRGPFDRAACDALGCADEGEWRAELTNALFYARDRVERFPTAEGSARPSWPSGRKTGASPVPWPGSRPRSRP